MCMICDGYSEEDVRRVIELDIITHGWHLVGVVPGADEPAGPTWTYSIGLTESHGLPELVVTDLAYPDAGALLNRVGAELAAGRSLNELDVGWAPVHPVHLHDELFVGWFDYYRLGPDDPTFIQLLPTVDPACPHCPDHMADLSDGDELFPHNRRSG